MPDFNQSSHPVIDLTEDEPPVKEFKGLKRYIDDPPMLSSPQKTMHSELGRLKSPPPMQNDMSKTGGHTSDRAQSLKNDASAVIDLTKSPLLNQKSHHLPIQKSRTRRQSFDIPQRLNDMALYGLFRSKVIGLTNYLPPADAPHGLDGVYLRRDNSQGDRASILVVTSRKQVVGYIDKQSATALTRLMDDTKSLQKLRLTAGIPVNDVPQSSTSVPLVIFFYGYERHYSVMRSILASYGVELSNAHITESVSVKREDYAERQVQDVIKLLASQEVELKETPAPSHLDSQLFPHQKMGLTFLLTREGVLEDPNDPPFWQKIPYVGGYVYQNLLTKKMSETRPIDCRGGILADDMGLGKSITMISLILADLENMKTNSESSASLEAVCKTTLIVCPPSVISNWQDQIIEHVNADHKLDVYVYHGTNRNSDPAFLRSFDVVITSYSTLASDFRKSVKAKPPPLLESNHIEIESSDDGSVSSVAFERIYWRRIVLDEAHVIKDSNTHQAKAIFQLRAERKWCLTGTPIQNKIDDVFSLIHFLGMEPFATKTWWSKHISKSPEGMQTLQVLMKFLTLRRTKSQEISGKPIVNIPPRVDSVWTIELSKQEREFYELIFSKVQEVYKTLVSQNAVMENYARLLEMFLRLRQICVHSALCSKSNLVHALLTLPEHHKMTHDEAQRTFRLLQESGDDVCVACLQDFTDVSDADSNEARKPMISWCGHLFCKACVSDLRHKNGLCPLCNSNIAAHHSFNVQNRSSAKSSNASLDEPFEDDVFVMPTPNTSTILTTTAATEQKSSPKPLPRNALSSKFAALITDLKVQLQREVKSVVFSQWTQALDLLEIQLQQSQISYLRFDGSMNIQQRQIVLQRFRTEDIPVLMISLKAGGVGLNLTSASRVYLLDPWWNPSIENQAIDRIHRLGQTKPVETIRIVIKNSIEDRIIELQQRKANIAQEALMDKGRTRMRGEDLNFLFQSDN